MDFRTNGLKPRSFLIGGIAGNFGTSARLGESEFFVIEADEYDTAFFDNVLNLYITIQNLIINNISFDHADIFDRSSRDPASIPSYDPHHLLQDAFFLLQMNRVKETLNMGCYQNSNLSVKIKNGSQNVLPMIALEFAVFHHGKKCRLK